MLHQLRRPARSVGLVLLVLAVIAAACGGDDAGDDGAADDSFAGSTTTIAQDVGSPQYGGTLIVGLEAETETWLPSGTTFAPSGTTVAMAIYDPLMILNADGELEPNLAESLEPNENLTEWTMTLRPGIQFHDGTPLDADAIKWNFDTLHNDETASSYGGVENAGLVGVDIVDDLTVVWRLSDTNAAFPDVLRTPVGWPVSPTAYESLGPDVIGAEPVGTGPFVFAEWTRDSRFVATRNENYWRTDDEGNRLPYLDEVEFRPVPDEASRLQSLASDTVQVGVTQLGSTARSMQELVDEGGYAGSMWVGNGSGVTVFNTLSPPLDDVRIRRAIVLSVDLEAINEVTGDGGLTEVSNSFFSVDSPWYSEAVSEDHPASGGPDVEAATALVDEYRADPDRSDGKAPGEPVEVDYACLPEPTLLQVAQLHQQLWGQSGIEVTLAQSDQSAHISNVVGSPDQAPAWSGTFQAGCFREGAEEGDPLASLQNFFGPVESTPGNFTNFTHPDVDAALEIMRTSPDFDERYAASEDIGFIMNEFVPVAWGDATVTYVGWRDDIQGILGWTTPEGSDGGGTAGAVVVLREAWLAD